MLRLALVLGVLLGVLIGGEQVGGVRGVDDALGAVLLQRLIDRGLEAGEVDRDVGLRQLGGLLHPELEVVRLLAGARQVDHDCVLAADPLGQELQRVHRRHHGDRAVVRAGGVVSAGCEGEQQQGGGGQSEGAAGEHDNDSQVE